MLSKYLHAKYSVYLDERRGDRIMDAEGMDSIPDMDDK